VIQHPNTCAHAAHLVGPAQSQLILLQYKIIKFSSLPASVSFQYQTRRDSISNFHQVYWSICKRRDFHCYKL